MRKKLALKTETLRSLNRVDLGAAAGGLPTLTSIILVSLQDCLSALQLCPKQTVGCPRDTTLG